MRCSEVKSLYSRRVDGELAAPEVAAFEAHLALCPACAADWQGWSAVVNGIRGLAAVPLSDTGRARLRRALTADAAPADRWARLWTWRPAAGLAAAAVLAFAVSAGVGLFTPSADDAATTARAVQALPHPAPELRLRDARTGGWVEAETLAAGLRRSQRQVAVVPRIRVPLGDVGPALDRHRERVFEALDRQGVQRTAVSFLTPVTVDNNLLAGPPVELWVEDIRPAAFAR
jgi:hypothetical protein